MKPPKRRNKRYVPRPTRTPMIVGAQMTIAPLQQIIDQIASDGTVNTSAKGVPMFQAGDGRWYDTAAALEGVIWHLDMYCARHSKQLPIQPLRELHICLAYITPISESLLNRLQAALPQIQREMALADPDDQVDLLRQTQIKDGLEQKAKSIELTAAGSDYPVTH